MAVDVPITQRARALAAMASAYLSLRDDVIKWKHFPRYWSYVRGIHRWMPVLMASNTELSCFFICARINDWENNDDAGDLRRHRTHYDVIVLDFFSFSSRGPFCYRRFTKHAWNIWHGCVIRQIFVLFSILFMYKYLHISQYLIIQVCPVFRLLYFHFSNNAIWVK